MDSAKGRAACSRAADDYACQIGPIAAAAWQDAGAAKGSYGRVAAILTDRGIRTLRGRQWTRAAMRSMIQRH